MPAYCSVLNMYLAKMEAKTGKSDYVMFAFGRNTDVLVKT